MLRVGFNAKFYNHFCLMVQELRNNGLSICKIAKKMDIKPSRVQYVLKCIGQYTA